MVPDSLSIEVGDLAEATLAASAKILQITRMLLLKPPTDGEQNKPGCYISWLLSTTWS